MIPQFITISDKRLCQIQVEFDGTFELVNLFHRLTLCTIMLLQFNNKNLLLLPSFTCMLQDVTHET